eukprot:TRINITY_DN3064_c0_g1_i4.p2 TRINITY_DN3064_c0_g1~~TRINITY_DN3064_c0_g1_i4.p2  ORF type:complete len:125 (+),score=29.92 TRINITY_DN3064_c0_g1_i4:94-468(+)
MAANGIPGDSSPTTMPQEDARVAWRAENNQVLLKKSQDESVQKQKLLDDAAQLREKLYAEMGKGAEERKAANRLAHQKLIEEQRPTAITGGNTWEVVNKMVTGSSISKPELSTLKTTIAQLGSK